MWLYRQEVRGSKKMTRLYQAHSSALKIKAVVRDGGPTQTMNPLPWSRSCCNRHERHCSFGVSRDIRETAGGWLFKTGSSETLECALPRTQRHLVPDGREQYGPEWSTKKLEDGRGREEVARSRIIPSLSVCSNRMLIDPSTSAHFGDRFWEKLRAHSHAGFG